MTDSAAFEAVVDRVTELLEVRIGLRPDSSLRGRLRRCIRDEAAAGGESADGYLHTLTTSPGTAQSLMNQVTVQESGFFRHPEHFRVLARDILPQLTEPVAIWSAGCANGQEAYSLAMVLQEQGVEGSVIATDLSTDALRRTAAGRYTTRELAGLSPDRLAHNLSRDDTGWRINAALRKRITVVHHNLIGGIPDRVRGCQVVFCRNVLIYFAPEYARSFLNRLADALPVAVLFLGAAETIWSVSDRYDTVADEDTFHYRPRTHGADRAGPTGCDLPARIAPTSRPVTPRHLPARTPIRPPVRPPAAAAVVPAGSTADTIEAAALGRAGELALEAGDHRAAAIAFRKCAYLIPDNAVAHLHLGLALEAAGDAPSARRAFGAARRAALVTTAVPDALGGYATTELLKLLDVKRRALGP